MLDSLVRVSRRAVGNHFVSFFLGRAQSPRERLSRAPPFHASPPRATQADSVTLVPNTFLLAVSGTFTLFSKFFSSFLHSTCSLSDSRQYLALEGIYLPIRTAVPNNPTRRRRIVRAGTQAQTGLSPSLALRSRRLVPLPLLMAASVDYNSPGWEILRLSFSRFTRRY